MFAPSRSRLHAANHERRERWAARSVHPIARTWTGAATARAPRGWRPPRSARRPTGGTAFQTQASRCLPQQYTCLTTRAQTHRSAGSPAAALACGHMRTSGRACQRASPCGTECPWACQTPATAAVPSPQPAAAALRGTSWCPSLARCRQPPQRAARGRESRASVRMTDRGPARARRAGHPEYGCMFQSCKLVVSAAASLRAPHARLAKHVH